MGHSRRRQPQRARRRVVPETGRDRRGSKVCRSCACKANGSTRPRACSTSISPNMFAGSILDLEPDTGYEARFVMSDPDGFIGQTAKIVTKTVTVRTRPEPKPYAGGRVFHVYPPDYTGHEDRAGLRRADVRVQLLLRRRRHGDRWPAPRQSLAIPFWSMPGCIDITPISIPATATSMRRRRSKARIT